MAHQRYDDDGHGNDEQRDRNDCQTPEYPHSPTFVGKANGRVPSPPVENRRRERLQGFLCASREHLLATRIAIPAGDAETRFTLDSLGPGVRLTPGMLSIEFGQPVELLQKLHTLAQAIAHEFEKFEGMAKRAPMATS